MISARWKNAILVLLLLVAVGFLFYNISSPLAIYPGEAKQELRRGKFDAVVDVRTKTEWDLGHYPLAVHIPIQDIEVILPQRIPDKSSKILFYCNTSTRARMGAERAKALGYLNVRYLVGTHTNLL